jgi:hypothetical protein
MTEGNVRDMLGGTKRIRPDKFNVALAWTYVNQSCGQFKVRGELLRLVATLVVL